LNRLIIKTMIIIFSVLFPLSYDAKQIDQGKASQTVSMNLKSVPIRLVLENLFLAMHRNVVLDPKITGNITISLNHVLLLDAYQSILRSHNLVQRMLGHIHYVTTFDAAVQYDARIEKYEPKKPMERSGQALKYAKAADVIQLLTAKKSRLLSKDGYAFADDRTNTIFLVDDDQHIKKAKWLIQSLDKPSPQILIKAKIVNIDDDCESELGLKFNFYHSHEKGTSEKLFIDLPGVSDASSPGHLALVKLLPGTYLDLELSALENEGKAEIISTPSLLTTNRKPAKIEAGEDIPYQESVSQGVTATAFKKAVLSLKVTPQMMSHHKILLNLEVSQDKRSNQEVQGVPAIDARHIMTQALIDDGQTIVLGGIYELTKIHRIQKLPFFSDLPLIGVLFKHKETVHNRREMLIFVTPKIVDSV
jgi:type IV pilus assembly protein PilQ